MAVGSRKDDGDRFVTVSELADKIAALRWELRFYALALVVAIVLKFQGATVPTSAMHAALRWLY